MYNPKICVVGLGYVGLPLAIELAKYFDVTGFDINESRINTLISGFDPTGETDTQALKSSSLNYSSDPSVIKMPIL